MSTVDSICSIVIFHICMSLFESILLSFCKPQSKFDLPTLRQGSRERKNATEQTKNMTRARIYVHIYMYIYTTVICSIITIFRQQAMFDWNVLMNGQELIYIILKRFT